VARGVCTHHKDAGDRRARASAYLATMDPAIQGCGGHDRLYAAATAMVHGFDLPADVARELLATEYNPRCVPPWDLSNPRDRRDFDRKVSEAQRQRHDRPRGWLLDAPPEGTTADAEHGAAIAA